MYDTLKELELKCGDLKDSMSMYALLQGEHVRQETFTRIVLKSIMLIVELLLFIIRHQH